MSFQRERPAEDRKRILIVEDEGIVAADIEKIVCEIGFAVTGIAASADQAIECASEDRPDLVLMDIRIQGDRDGIQTAEILRRDFGLPIIYLTAHGDRETIARAKRTEPLAFLVKPFKKSELQGAIEVALHKHEADQRLRERERWLTTTLNALANAVISVDLEQRVLLCNPAAEALIGCDAARAQGQHVDQILRLLDASGASLSETPIATSLRELRPVSFTELRLPERGEGTSRFVRVSAAPVEDAGRMLGAVMILEDVTERRKFRQTEQEVEIQRMRSEYAEAAVQQRDEFLAVAAHELRSPLTALQLKLQSSLEKLKELPGAPLVGRLERALRHTDRLSQLIERLLDVSRIVNGKLELRREPADLAQLVHQLVEDFHEQAAAAGCEIRLRASGDASGTWDHLLLRQVVVNLLSNAVKFAAGKPVEIGVEDAGASVRLTVADHGPGISRADAERIFDRFERAVSIRHYAGMGLGLFIVRHIVERHGGAIAIDQTPGGGASFVIELPRNEVGASVDPFRREQVA
jgi:PAS domain S-box-containing protein